jgi:hypothetical protein
MKRIAMIVGLTAAACGGGAKDKSDTVVAPVPTTTAILTIGPATMSADMDGKHMELAVAADGKVTADGRELGMLTPAGEVKATDGRLVASIDADGKVTIPGETEEIIVRADGAVLDKGAVVLEVGPDGLLTGPLVGTEMSNAKIAITGAPDTRRAMMLAFITAMFVSARSEPGTVEGSAPAPPTP